jgi:alpha-aminoadipic semialdehyde synthase
MYWDNNYPRLITKQQMKQHMDTGLSKFIGVADITCDLQGSVEFLDYISSIQNPFYIYDPDTDSCFSDLASPGVLMMGVDNLPSELPLDASEHFGQQLLPFLKVLSESNGSLPFKQQSDLPLPLQHAVITANGALTPNFAYIQALRDSRSSASLALDRERSSSSQLIRVRGHLFDTGLINRIIDLCEENEDVSARLLQVVPGRNRQDSNSMSVAVLEIRAATDSGVHEVVQRIQKLCSRFSLASATIQHVPTEIKNNLELASALAPPRISGHQLSAKSTTQPPKSTSVAAAAAAAASAVVHPSRRVLVLGSGYVSGPCVRYLCRDPSNEIIVLSADGPQAAALVAGIPNATAATFDASNIEKLSQYIRGSDVVVSLLPATMHGPVAAACVREKRHMVTEAAAARLLILSSRIVARSLLVTCLLPSKSCTPLLQPLTSAS